LPGLSWQTGQPYGVSAGFPPPCSTLHALMLTKGWMAHAGAFKTSSRWCTTSSSSVESRTPWTSRQARSATCANRSTRLRHHGLPTRRPSRPSRPSRPAPRGHPVHRPRSIMPRTRRNTTRSTRCTTTGPGRTTRGQSTTCSPEHTGQLRLSTRPRPIPTDVREDTLGRCVPRLCATLRVKRE
jgi:hypothetical protein